MWLRYNFFTNCLFDFVTQLFLYLLSLRSMGLYLVVLVFRISVNQSGINKIIHEGWEKPLVNISLFGKGGSGNGLWKEAMVGGRKSKVDDGGRERS